MTTGDGGPRRPPIASHLRGNRRPARAAGGRGRRRPRPGPVVRGDARLARRPGLPEPQHALPAHRRRVDADGADLARADHRAACPTPSSATLGANPGFGAAANEVLRLVEGDSGFFCFCHDDVALDPDADPRCSSRSCTARTPASSARSSSTWDDPERAPARRARPRPLRRGRPDHRAGRVRPGAARRRPRRVRPPVGLPARARRPVPRARRLRPGDHVPRRRRRPVLARPPERRPRRRRPAGPGPPPRGARRSAGPTSTTTCCGPATGCAPSPR